VCAIRAAVLAGLSLIAGVSIGGEPATYSESDFSRVEKIDTHVHLHGSLPQFMKRAQVDGFRLLTINVNYSTFPPMPEQRADALALTRQYPERVAFAATFDASDSKQSGGLARVQDQLKDDLAHGAVGVKVWKDIGMQQRDADGRAVMVDDARFTPIFRFLEQRGVVVLGHQGEPRNAWLPLDQMTTRGDRQYFTEHPEYHMFAHAEWPSYEEQLAARDRLLTRHPKMKFLALHLASLEWNLDRTGDFLNRYPNASVDLAARLVHLKLQTSMDRERVQQFFIRFQDRIVYATDLTRLPDQSDSAFAEEAHTVWLEDWRFLSGSSELHSDEFDAPFRGLALPSGVLDKIYHGNAKRLFPSGWRD
jgi:predicted TIM-barrel fold metal-dependent hydrolase